MFGKDKTEALNEQKTAIDPAMKAFADVVRETVGGNVKELTAGYTTCNTSPSHGVIYAASGTVETDDAHPFTAATLKSALHKAGWKSGDPDQGSPRGTFLNFTKDDVRAQILLWNDRPEAAVSSAGTCIEVKSQDDQTAFTARKAVDLLK